MLSSRFLRNIIGNLIAKALSTHGGFLAFQDTEGMDEVTECQFPFFQSKSHSDAIPGANAKRDVGSLVDDGLHIRRKPVDP